MMTQFYSMQQKKPQTEPQYMKETLNLVVCSFNFAQLKKTK